MGLKADGWVLSFEIVVEAATFLEVNTFIRAGVLQNLKKDAILGLQGFEGRHLWVQFCHAIETKIVNLLLEPCGEKGTTDRFLSAQRTHQLRSCQCPPPSAH